MSLVAFRHYLATNPRYLYCLLRQKARQFRRLRWVDAHAKTNAKVPPPLVYKVTLTDRCNLACEMCMNIPDHDSPPVRTAFTDIDFELLRRLIADVAPGTPWFILSGGEPMLHPRFADLVELLERNSIPTNICTNGTAIRKHLGLFEDNRFTQLTISLDGVRDDNDAIRGSGVYDTVVSAIRSLRETARRRLYIGIQHTLRPKNVASIHAFCKDMVALDVDWILLNPCWHLTQTQASRYADFMREEHGVQARSQQGYVMDCDIDPEVFAEQLGRIRAEPWPIQISCYYGRPAEDLRRLQEDNHYFCGNTLCYKQWLRMDVMPDGKVVSCQQYPDVVLGDLHRERWQEVWNGKAFEGFRAAILRRPLPVCNRCAPIYLYDRKRMHL
ncbi:MAG TPA: radical SAM protein [Candidatus Acidoferrales bacterium]|nr:radical SAM protein [Candidatus Acidoferrales bacterium]